VITLDFIRIKRMIRERNTEKVANILKGLRYMVPSYAQNAEDLLLRNFFFSQGKEKIYYLEIGTNHPCASNNTYLFYSGGSQGTCVEANPRLIAPIKKVRPRDTVLNIGVGVEGSPDTLPFYAMTNDHLSTFSKEQADWCLSQGTTILEEIAIPVWSVNKILASCPQLPDLLSLDVEGLDFAILQNLDFETYPIPVICVETDAAGRSSESKSTVEDFLRQKKYDLYAQTGINSIFVRQ
jgi:FkbM family methyltransferase